MKVRYKAMKQVMKVSFNGMKLIVNYDETREYPFVLINATGKKRQVVGEFINILEASEEVTYMLSYDDFL